MDSSFEIKGLWWLPEMPERQVPGTLLFSPGEPIFLELMGTLNNSDAFMFTHDNFINPPIIQGKSAEGKPVTLQKCLQIQGTMRLTGMSSTKFIGHSAYVGVHFSNSEKVKFKSLSVKYHNLDEWFGKNGFNLETPTAESVTVTYKRPAPTKVSFEDFHIDFAALGPSFSSDRYTHVDLSQKAIVHIWLEEEKGLEEFFPLVRHIQNLLTLAMSKPTFVTEVVGKSEAAKQDNPVFYHPIQVYYAAIGWSQNPPKSDQYEMLFTLPLVEDDLEKILGNWIKKAEIIKPVYDLYFSALYNPSIYPEFHFLSLAQAIETYHRQIYQGKYQSDDKYREGLYKILVNAIPQEVDKDFRSSLKNGKLMFANEYSLRKRLQLLGEHFSQKIDINFLSDTTLRKKFSDKVTDTRNYFTHYPVELKEKAALGGEELQELILKLRLTLQLCFLEELGFSFDEIKLMLKKKMEYKDYFS